MIHHVSVGTNDLARSIAFYDAVLPGLGLRRILDDPGEGMHYGTGHIEFSTIRTDAPATAGNGVHVALDVEDRGMVDAFHAAALAAGGRDDGPPGLRPHYDAHYYAAFVRDPDGNKIEAVTFGEVGDPAPSTAARGGGGPDAPASIIIGGCVSGSPPSRG